MTQRCTVMVLRRMVVLFGHFAVRLGLTGKGAQATGSEHNNKQDIAQIYKQMISTPVTNLSYSKGKLKQLLIGHQDRNEIKRNIQVCCTGMHACRCGPAANESNPYASLTHSKSSPWKSGKEPHSTTLLWGLQSTEKGNMQCHSASADGF